MSWQSWRQVGTSGTSEREEIRFSGPIRQASSSTQQGSVGNSAWTRTGWKVTRVSVSSSPNIVLGDSRLQSNVNYEIIYVSFIRLQQVKKFKHTTTTTTIYLSTLKTLRPLVDLHWFFEISISAFISNWDKNSVINKLKFFFQCSLKFFFSSKPRTEKKFQWALKKNFS